MKNYLSFWGRVREKLFGPEKLSIHEHVQRQRLKRLLGEDKIHKIPNYHAVSSELNKQFSNIAIVSGADRSKAKNIMGTRSMR